MVNFLCAKIGELSDVGGETNIPEDVKVTRP